MTEFGKRVRELLIESNLAEGLEGMERYTELVAKGFEEVQDEARLHGLDDRTMLGLLENALARARKR